jgi:lipoic acid synthetase
MNIESMKELGTTLRSLKLHTVSDGALCPHMGECFKKKTATFLILGDVCTRNCTFCAIPSGKPAIIDTNEPLNVARAAKQLGLKHIVITSVTRDDLADGGSSQFANCIYEIKKGLPTATIEILIPDFKADVVALDKVIAAAPNIINHNIETVPSLYSSVRPLANYEQSLAVLRYVKQKDKTIITKSGIMLGLGEQYNEVLALFDDLVGVNCDMLTIGQYLPPSNKHIALKEYIEPQIFEEYRFIAMNKGFKYVSSAPYVRSSYIAEEGLSAILKK